MTVLARPLSRDVPVWELAPSLKRLAERTGEKPRLAPKWPCLQLQQSATEEAVDALLRAAMELAGVEACDPPFEGVGHGLSLRDDLARGQPEAFIRAPCWMNLRPDGSMHLSLRPEWAQKVLNKSWATVHPFARYMAGAVPPQSLVTFAPRDPTELGVMTRILEAAHGYAVGRIGNVILPDTRW